MGSILLLFACGFAPSASVGDLVVQELTLEGATAELTVAVDNPWPLEPEVDARWSFLVDSAIVAQGESIGNTVASRDVTTVRLPITWKWADLWAAAGAVGEAVPWRAELLLQGEHALGTWTLPLAVEGTLPALSIPDVDLLGWRVDEVTPWRVAWTLIVGVSGPLPITDLTWVATLGGRVVAHGGLSIASGSIEIPVAFELAAFPEAAWNAFEKGASLKVDGGIATPIGRLPLSYSLAWSATSSSADER